MMRKGKVVDFLLEKPWGFVALALVVRFFFLHWEYAFYGDEPHYCRMAVGFARSGWHRLLHIYWSPGYPFFASFWVRLLPDAEFACRLTNILFGALTIVPIHAMAKRFFGRTGAFASFLYAVYPPMAVRDVSAMAESTFVFFAFAGLTLGWWLFETRSFWHALLTGIAFGLAYAAKPEGMAFFIGYVVLLLGLWMVDFVKGRGRPPISLLGVIVVAFLIPAGGYLVYLRQEAGNWVISGKTRALQEWHTTFFTPEDDDIFHDLDEGATIFLNDAILHQGNYFRILRERPAPPISVTPKLFLKKYATYLYRLVKYDLPSALSAPIGVLFVLGLFGMPWKGNRFWLSAYLSAFIAGYWFLLLPMMLVTERYILSLFPAVVVWCTGGFQVLSAWATATFPFLHRFYRRGGEALVLLFLAGGSLLPEAAKVVAHSPMARNPYADPVELKEAGLWIREHAHGTPILASMYKTADFYAGNDDVHQGIAYPRDTSERILQYARHHGVTHFVVSERYWDEHPPAVRSWVELPPKELVLAHTVVGPSGLRVWIFTWDRQGPSGGGPL